LPDGQLVTSPLDRLVLRAGIEVAMGRAQIPKGQIMTTETSNNRPTHRVYAVIKKESQEKGTWLEIGVAWPHRDGKGYGVMLNFIPRSPDAELVIRAIEPKAAAPASSGFSSGGGGSGGGGGGGGGGGW
jgi:hypothetical protein